MTLTNLTQLRGNDLILFYENAMMDVVTQEQLHKYFRPKFTSDPTLLLYTKTNDVTVQRMTESFRATRGSYFTEGKPGDYFIQDKAFPFHQFALPEQDFKKYIIQRI
jgi:hypothetical protein